MKVALVAIVKYESNLAEWVLYHKKLGFDKIYLLANDWTPGVIQGTVVIPYPGKAIQLSAYNYWIMKYGMNYDYAAFFDADEYLFVESGNVKDLLGGNYNLAINWVFFGTKSEQSYRHVVDRFLYRDNVANKHIKTIVKMHPTVKMMNPHFCNTRTISTIGEQVIGPFTKVPTMQDAFLAHYYYQDELYWHKKVDRGRADTVKQTLTIDGWDSIDYNKVKDERLKQFMYGK